MKFVCSRVVATVLFLFTVLLCACEDDPLLEPQENESSGGGSYGLIDLDSTRATVTESQSSNPAVF